MLKNLACCERWATNELATLSIKVIVVSPQLDTKVKELLLDRVIRAHMQLPLRYHYQSIIEKPTPATGTKTD